MNRSLFALSLLFFMAATSAMAQSDDETGIEFRIKGGWNFLNDELFDGPANELKDNWAISGELIYWFSTTFGIGGEVEYYKRETDSFRDLSPFEILTNQPYSFRSIPVNLNAYYRWQTNDAKIRPYVGGGISALNLEVGRVYVDAGEKVPNTESTYDEVAFGFNVIGGIEYGRFFAEIQWLWAESDLGFDEDMNVGGTSIWFGIRF